MADVSGSRVTLLYFHSLVLLKSDNANGSCPRQPFNYTSSCLPKITVLLLRLFAALLLNSLTTSYNGILELRYSGSLIASRVSISLPFERRRDSDPRVPNERNF